MTDPLTLMLVTHRQGQTLGSYLPFVEACAQAGITSVQLREKDSPLQERLAFAQALKACLTPYAIPLIINDDPELALHVNAAGVHLGQSDYVHHIFPPTGLRGLTVNTVDHIHKANTLSTVNYYGIGPIFPTLSKRDVTSVWGLEGLQQAAELAKRPLVAIGGITLDNGPDVLAAGAHGLAVISAIHEASDPGAMVQAFLRIFPRNGRRSNTCYNS